MLKSKNSIDLQLHSTCSDGVMPVGRLIATCQSRGLKVVALTDHDTVEGVIEACMTAQLCGMVNIPALELTTSDPRGDILGYRINPTDSKLIELLNQQQRWKANWGGEMVTAIQEEGYHLDFGIRDRLVNSRMYSEAVYHDPRNADLLRRRGFLDWESFYHRGFKDEGAPMKRTRQYVSVRSAAEAIRSAGGIVVLSSDWTDRPGPTWGKDKMPGDVDHPFALENEIRELKGMGIEGIECFYPKHDAKRTADCLDFARRHGLMITGSSDYHGPNEPKRDGQPEYPGDYQTYGHKFELDLRFFR